MDLPGVIAHLKANWPSVAGRVAGSAEGTGAMLGELRPEAWPAAYVVPLGEDATENDESNALYQVVTERVGILVEFDNAADRRGQSVTQLYAETRAALFAALLNWRGLDPEHAIRGFEFAGGGLVQNDRARLFYQWEFTFPIAIDESDGWQVDAPPLVRIEANDARDYPDAPTPAFAVDLPQTIPLPGACDDR